MPQISVVIVNYNVKHFLELCLHSVRAASAHLQVEVWVVDNNSQDGSCDMVRNLFPEVKLIANTDNPGFGKANNQAIAMASGEYVLILNPDTIISESTLSECNDFMRLHPDAGALGVHMVDGNGRFLRESKRSLPTPGVSFFKIFGFAGLFPHSKTFAKYHLGYLDRNQTHRVEILSGAFMFVRKSLLDQIGYFDEQFFMYGEDIDLAYRVILGGYHNYYLGGTRIIHFKGESTKKGSLNYVVVFYKAMEIFARKHFTGHRVSPIRMIIETAIWLRAFVAASKRLFGWLLNPFAAVGRMGVRRADKVGKTVWVAPAVEKDLAAKLVANDELWFVECLDLDIDQLLGKIRTERPQSLVLSMGGLSNAAIIDLFARLSGTGVHLKLLSPNGRVLVWGGMGTGV